MLKTKTNTLVILAAGASSRMKHSLKNDKEILSTFSSKALLPLGDKSEPAITYLIRNAKKAGLERILLVVPEKSEPFRSYFGKKDDENDFEGTRLGYVIQDIPCGRKKPLGTADALKQTLDQYPKLLTESFLVCNGDNLYSIEALRQLSQSHYPNALVGYDRDGLDFPLDRIKSFALLKLDETNKLISIIEKPTREQTLHFQQSNNQLVVSMNIWKFHGGSLYPFLKNCPTHPTRNEKELPTAVLNMITSGNKVVQMIPLKEHVPDLTSVEDIEKVEAYLRKKNQ